MSKINVPWKTNKANNLNLYSGSDGDLVKSGGEWYVLCLRIGSPKDGRWYARKEDGSQWRISVRRATEYVSGYEWSREKVYLNNGKTKDAPYKEQREAWNAIKAAGQDRAHEVRDRISTRRMNTSMRRGMYGF